jgi:hypothetical protein
MRRELTPGEARNRGGEAGGLIASISLFTSVGVSLVHVGEAGEMLPDRTFGDLLDLVSKLGWKVYSS